MAGNHHLKYVQVCDCEPVAVTLLKCQFWPGSPANPTTGFNFKLMEFVEKVFLHCQVSLLNIKLMEFVEKVFLYCQVSLLNISEVIAELNPQLQPRHVGLHEEIIIAIFTTHDKIHVFLID